MLKRRDRYVEQPVADECAAFLAGTFAELQRRRGLPPTAWMVLNLPAHGSFEEIQEDLLVPVELAMCAERLSFSTTLGGVVSRAIDALDSCRPRSG